MPRKYYVQLLDRTASSTSNFLFTLWRSFRAADGSQTINATSRRTCCRVRCPDYYFFQINVPHDANCGNKFQVHKQLALFTVLVTAGALLSHTCVKLASDMQLNRFFFAETSIRVHWRATNGSWHRPIDRPKCGLSKCQDRVTVWTPCASPKSQALSTRWSCRSVCLMHHHTIVSRLPNV